MTTLRLLHVRELLRQPYPFYANTRQAWQLVMGISVFIGVFCLVFTPFNLSRLAADIRPLVGLGFGLVTFVATMLNMVFMPRLFPKLFQESNWRVWKELVWVCWMVLIIATLNYVYAQFFFEEHDPWEGYGVMLKYTAVIAILPAIGVIFYKQLYQYKQNLEEVAHLNELLKNKNEGELSHHVVLSSTNGNDHLKVDHREIAFIASAGNYVEIFYSELGQPRKMLIRNKISAIAEQLAGYPLLQRCHRTFIVNVKKVSYLEGNSQGYKLHLLDREEVIPVSRSFSGNIKKMIEAVFNE